MKSYWVEKTTRPSFLNLQEDIEADVCIIGTGITGIVTGYMLLETGLKICIIDKGEICSLETILQLLITGVALGFVYALVGVEYRPQARDAEAVRGSRRWEQASL